MEQFCPIFKFAKKFINNSLNYLTVPEFRPDCFFVSKLFLIYVNYEKVVAELK